MTNLKPQALEPATAMPATHTLTPRTRAHTLGHTILALVPVIRAMAAGLEAG